MSRLIRDRYYACGGGQACDLATGEVVDLDRVDERGVDEPPLESLVEVLEHGRDGVPRWIVADVPPGRNPAGMLARAAADGQNRGMVPIAVEVYGRLGPLIADAIADRTLLLIGGPVTSPEAARAALVDAAARSPRPHVLLTCRAAPGGTGLCVREARAAYDVRPAPPSRLPALPSPDVARHVARAARAQEFARGGRHAAAVRLLRDAAGALLRRRATAQAVDALLTLAALLLDRGRATEADSAAGEAASLAQQTGDDGMVTRARLWQAAARTDKGHLTAAESLCRAVLLGGAGSVMEQRWAAALLARVLLWQDRVDEAAGLDLGLPAGEPMRPELAAFLAATASRVLMRHGRFFDAGQRVHEGLASTGGDLRGRTILLTARLRVLAATGDITLVEAALGEVTMSARQARLPLYAVRARMIWIDVLARAGRDRDADRERARLRKVRRAVPALLRRAIDLRLDRRLPPPAAHETAPAALVPRAAADLVALAQDEADDATAIRQVLEHVRARVGAGRLDLWSADAGPPTIVSSAGPGTATRCGARVLEAGIAVAAGPGDSGRELGVPVRLGPRLLAALVARWPLDRVVPAKGEELLLIAAAVLAPRIDSRQAAARAETRAVISVPELVGVSGAMAELRRAIARAAAAPFSVLIEGESGVGKELVARAVHQLGPRRERRFCDVNCAALPDDLLEAELFGHARGAFTGAVADRAGLFEEADGGTLFLDEVADLSPRAQAKLLRVLQQYEVRRVGETFTRKVDVRVVSAANREMRAEAAARRFREDLLYRLDVIRIRIPPLRERPEDIPVLAEHFWQAAAQRVGTRAGLSHAVLAALSRYQWPGNVRELQNVIAALAVAAPPRGRVSSSLIPAAITGAAPAASMRLEEARAAFERRFVAAALARAGGSRSRAAQDLGLSRQGLLKTLRRLGLTLDDCRTHHHDAA